MRYSTTLLIGVATFVGATAIAAPASARDHGTKLGKGDYQFHIFPEEKVRALFPDLKDSSKVIPDVTTRDFDVMNVTDAQCREDDAGQAPGWFKDVGLYTLRTAPLSLAGGTLAAMAGGFAPKGSIVSNFDYGKNAAVQTVFGAIGAGINLHEMAKHTSIAGCQAGMVQRAQNGGYLNRNIIVTYSVYAARGHPVTRERFAAPAPGDTKPAPATNAAGQVPAPPSGL